MRLVQLPTSISHKCKLCRCHSKSDLNCDDREKKQTRFQLYSFFATLERLYPQARPQPPNPLTYPPTLQPKPLAMQDPSQGLTFCQAQGHKVTATVLSGDPPRSSDVHPRSSDVQRCPRGLGSEMMMEQQLHHVLWPGRDGSRIPVTLI